MSKPSDTFVDGKRCALCDTPIGNDYPAPEPDDWLIPLDVCEDCLGYLDQLDLLKN